MRRKPLHAWASCLTVRRLVILWAASVFLAWAVLVAGWLAARARLAANARRVHLDAHALDMVRALELAVLAERRADLLWQITGDDPYRQQRDGYQARAGQIAAGFDPYITSAEENELLNQIRKDLHALYDRSESPTHDPLGTVSQAADELLLRLSQFREQNRSQMEGSIHAADRMYSVLSYWALGLSVGTAALLLAGCVAVIHRVVRPALTLIDAAGAFGRGQLAARAPVLYDDELGALARTFNNMADDIADRERNRLDFVAMVVHDLKNPVLTVEMAGRMLRVCTGNDPACREYFDAIDAEVKRLRMIVGDLMDDVQVASGRFSMRKVAVPVCELVRRLVQEQSRTLADHKIITEMEEGCIVLGDARRIERILMNLLSNAVKYSPRGTEITIRVWREEPFGVLSISDQGPGIAREDLDVIFQPFGRGRFPGAEGTGMGLYVVKQIVEAHAGRIEVQSRPGHGTVFRVYLPLAGQQAGT